MDVHRSSIISIVLGLSACGGGGTVPPVTNVSPSAAPVNVNSANPDLTVVVASPVRPGDTLHLVWSDEFEGERLDPEKWYFETGDGSQYGIPGWGNEELQWYVPDNARLDAGMLEITARRERRNDKDYTSARITTIDRFAFQYGRIEARIRLPGGQGLWPAFWMLPQDRAYGAWAASGEIDIMEAVNLGGAGGNSVHGTIHYGGEWPENTYTGNEYVVATDATADFHEYALEWDETALRWYVDGVLYATQDAWHTSAAAYPAPFDRPFYVLLNVAVGGSWPGSPDASTAFPARMQVDYVRVYSGEP